MKVYSIPAVVALVSILVFFTGVMMIMIQSHAGAPWLVTWLGFCGIMLGIALHVLHKKGNNDEA